MNAQKQSLRTAILTRRRALTRTAVDAAATAVAEHVLGEVRRRGWRRVAAYVPIGSEPGSPGLLDALTARGASVLLPVLLPGGDLDWACHDSAAQLVAARHGLREPAGPRLGVEAVCEAELLLVPALAVDRRGHRLGRGGGSYDRALARVADGVPIAALLYDDELVDEVPVEPHDRVVTHVVTPEAGWQRVG